MPKVQSLVCSQDTDCSHFSHCDGQGAKCPAPIPKPDETVCQHNTKICHRGVRKNRFEYNIGKSYFARTYVLLHCENRKTKKYKGEFSLTVF